MTSVVLEVEATPIEVSVVEVSVDVSVPAVTLLVETSGPPGPPGADGAQGDPGPPGADSTVPGPPGADYDPAEADLRYVNLTGDTMTGPLVAPWGITASGVTTDLLSVPPGNTAFYGYNGELYVTDIGWNANKNINLAEPTAATHAATKQYVDGKAPTLPPETDALGNTSYGAGSQPYVIGTNNSALGINTQSALTSGIGNVAIGNNAQSAPNNKPANATTTGNYQMAIGMGSGQYSANPSNHGVGIGINALYEQNAVAIGGAAQARASNSVAIGYNAVATLANQIMLGAATARVYVNNDPEAELEVATKRYVDGKAPTLPPETDALYNTSYGVGTHNGGAAITGRYNNAVGWNAQLQLTTGLNNNAMGAQTQFSLTTGSDNCAVGSSAQYSVKGGTGNTGIGSSAQWGLTSGTDNVGIGFQSAYNLTTGFDNVAIGWRAQFTLATAWRNTAVGHAAQRGLTTGNYNTAIGEGAQYEPKNLSANATTTATGQTAIGPYTGQYAAGTGNYGTALGYGAVYHTGATAVGHIAEARGVNSTALGKGAIATLDNQIMLGTATERVDIPGALYVKGIQVGTMLADLEARLAALEAA